MSARAVGWLLVGVLAVVVMALGGPAQAWATATTWLGNQPAVSSVTNSFTNTGTQGSGGSDSGPEEPGDP